MSAPVDKKQVDLKPMDQLVYKTVINSFNKKYDEQLLDEQKTLIHKYTLSFSDGGFGFVSYMNEEIGRIKSIIKESNSNEAELDEKLKAVLELIDSFRNQPINEQIIKKVLKLQSLVKELESDGDNN